MVNIVKNFSQVHDVSQNNIITGDFNFADNEVDKEKGMSQRDNMVNSPWREFQSEAAIVDPFRIQCPKNVFTSSFTMRAKVDDRVYVNEENVPKVTNHR